MADRTRWTVWLARALLLFACWRLGGLWLDEPLLGVANNYDMIRLQACIDAYPLRDAAIAPEAQSHDQPLQRYHFVADVGAPCFLSSENLFAYLAWPAMRIEAALSADRGFSIRWIGAARLIALFALVLWAHRRIRARGDDAQALGHAAVVALVLADPAVGLYLNTFYSEFSAVFFAYALLALLWLGLQGSVSDRSLRVGLLLAALGLALAKLQHIGTPAFMLSLLLVLRWLCVIRIEPRLLAALAWGALLGGLIQAAHMGSGQNASIARANLVNTILFGVLPQAEDPARFVRDLGLPPDCAQLVGASWFTPGMAQGRRCPEAQQLSRLDMLPALLQQPDVVPRLMVEMAMRHRPWVPQFLGLVAGTSMGRLPARHPSLDSLISAWPAWIHFGLLAGLPFASWCLIRWRDAPAQQGTNAVLAILALYPWFGLAVVAFGDGGIDASKQSHLATTALVGAVLLLIMLALRPLQRCASTPSVLHWLRLPRTVRRSGTMSD